MKTNETRKGKYSKIILKESWIDKSYILIHLVCQSMTGLGKGQAEHGLGMGTGGNWAWTGHGLGTGTVTSGIGHGLGTNWAQSRARLGIDTDGHGTGGLRPNVMGTHYYIRILELVYYHGILNINNVSRARDWARADCVRTSRVPTMDTYYHIIS
jgi:hypothetical protein